MSYDELTYTNRIDQAEDFRDLIEAIRSHNPYADFITEVVVSQLETIIKAVIERDFDKAYGTAMELSVDFNISEKAIELITQRSKSAE